MQSGADCEFHADRRIKLDGAGSVDPAVCTSAVGLSMPSVIEDRTLAMAEGDYVVFKTSRPVLSAYFERNVAFTEMSSVVGKLSAMDLLFLRVKHGGRYYFRKWASINEQRSCSGWFAALAVAVRPPSQALHATCLWRARELRRSQSTRSSGNPFSVLGEARRAKSRQIGGVPLHLWIPIAMLIFFTYTVAVENQHRAPWPFLSQ